MTNLCARCGNKVSYSSRRFADHRWFCSQECSSSWEAGPRHAEAAPPATTRRGRSPIVILLIALASIAGLVLVMGSCVVVLTAMFYERSDLDEPGADNPIQADVRNRELMASLPSVPSSVLVEEDVWDEFCCHPAQRFRLLTQVYATSETLDDVISFYRDRLTEAGWEDLREVTGGYGFRRENIVTFMTPLQPLPSGDFAGLSGTAGLQLVSTRPVQAPPAGLSTFYGVTTSRRIDCLRVNCLK